MPVGSILEDRDGVAASVRGREIGPAVSVHVENDSVAGSGRPRKRHAREIERLRLGECGRHREGHRREY